MGTEVAVLPPSVVARGVSLPVWNTLCDSLFPGAKVDSILMVLDYCKARGLDPMKKPCHIVPISVRSGDGWAYRDVVMPGIYEYRMTANRTGLYLGHSEPDYGPKVDLFGVKAPEWCRMTMYRWHEKSQSKIEFPVMVLFSEVCATKDGKANQRWAKAPVQMMTKCCEAAGLREAFPDELGGTHTDDEMYGKAIDGALAQSVEPRSVTPEDSGSNPERPSNGDKNPSDWKGPKAESKRRGKPVTKEPERIQATPVSPQEKDTPSDNFSDQSGGDLPEVITKSQVTLLEHRLKAAGIPPSEFCATFEIGTLAELPFDKMQDASGWIEQQ